MDAFAAHLSTFHFLRPWCLLAVPAAIFLWWIIRKAATRDIELPSVIASHLAAALTVRRQSSGRVRPVDLVAMVLCLLSLSAAGPTWSRIPNPLVADTAPLVVVLKVAKSMLGADVPPSRLERAKHKALDLLEIRPGAKTALAAYSGTAHQVVPLTEDPTVLKPFLEGLSPAVMPREGEAARHALDLAEDLLKTQEMPGSILFLLDGITDADVAAFNTHLANGGAPVLFWFFGQDAGARAKLQTVSGARVVDVRIDAGDASEISGLIEASYQAALSEDDQLKWNDRGWIFSWPAALLLLFMFRRGWTMQWTALIVACGLLIPAGSAKADGWRDWFLTADQQGKMAFDAKDYQHASDLFEDPIWKAYALYRLGKYEEAAELYGLQQSADAAIGQGLALIKSRSYRPAVSAFERAVEREPDNLAAQHNLALARHIVDYIETTREQSDTGETSGIGADDVVYDNEAGRGTDSQQQQSSGDTLPESAEQWMRTVDTRTGDFLKTRFSLEAARSAP